MGLPGQKASPTFEDHFACHQSFPSAMYACVSEFLLLCVCSVISCLDAAIHFGWFCFRALSPPMEQFLCCRMSFLCCCHMSCRLYQITTCLPSLHAQKPVDYISIGGWGLSPTGKSFRFVRRARTHRMPSEDLRPKLVPHSFTFPLWPRDIFPFPLGEYTDF